MCNDLKCKFCGSDRINKRGKQKYNGKQRYLCRDCGKIWTDGKDNRLKYSNKKREKVIKMYLENVSIRSIERLEGVSEPLILKWIKKMGKEIKNKFNESINKIKDNINNDETANNSPAAFKKDRFGSAISTILLDLMIFG